MMSQIILFCSLMPLSLGWTPIYCPMRCSCQMEFHRGLETELRTVNCRNSELTSVPDLIPVDAQCMVLAKNRITEVKSDQFWPRNLLVLDLSGNQIRKIGKRASFGHLSSLQVLDLSRNRITHADERYFEDLFNLRTLDLSWNSISGLDERVFRNLHKLETLSLNRNRLTFIPQKIWHALHNLYELNLSHNYLSVIQQNSLRRLFSLLMLDLSHNRILQIHPLAFADLIRLEYLKLDGNQMTSVPRDCLKVFTRTLKSLSLGRNPINRIKTGDFIDMLQLREISMTHMNRLTIVEAGSFGDMPQLLMLQLHDNPQFTFFSPDSFRKGTLPKLGHLLIHNSNLPTVDPDMIRNMPALEEISFYGNPLACDCTATWIYETIKSAKKGPKFRESERLTCASPDLLKFRTLSSLEQGSLANSCKPTMLSLGHTSIKARVGDSVAIDCAAIGNPRPDISWSVPTGAENLFYYRNNKQTIVFDQITPAAVGKYKCLAENIAGSASLSMKIEVSAKPVEIDVKLTDSSSILVVWNKIDEVLANLLVVKRLINDKYYEDYQVPLNSLMTSYMVQNLAPGSDYEVCVAHQQFEEVRYLPLACQKFQTSSGNQIVKVPLEDRSLAVIGAIVVLFCGFSLYMIIMLKIHCSRHVLIPYASFTGLCKVSPAFRRPKVNFYASNIQRSLIPSNV